MALENRFTSQEIEASLDIFSRPDSYDRFDLTRDKKRIVGCIDPRSEEMTEGKRIPIIMQTAGGAYGEGHDMANALIAIHGKPIGIDYGIAADFDRRRQSHVLSVHGGCRFKEDIGLVLEEESNPGQFTNESVERWARLHDRWPSVKNVMGHMVESAGVQLEQVRTQGAIDRLEPIVDELYPDHENLRTMVGINRARIYVVNHHSHVGLDRNKIHRQHAVQVQGYHDSLRAIINSLQDRKFTRRERSLRVAGAYLRAAATRTVLGSLHDDTRYIEISPSNNKTGLEVEEIKPPTS